jgi:hypothetical protein
MKEENPYESPKTVNEAVPSNKLRTVKILTRIASFSEIVGWILLIVGFGGGTGASIVLGIATGFLLVYLGAALCILGIIVAMVAVAIWFMSGTPIGPLESELREKFGSGRASKTPS